MEMDNVPDETGTKPSTYSPLSLLKVSTKPEVLTCHVNKNRVSRMWYPPHLTLAPAITFGGVHCQDLFMGGSRESEGT